MAGLVFEPVTAVAACRQEDGGRRWSCSPRAGVRFHDGVALTPAGLAMALPSALSPAVAGDSVVLHSGQAIVEAPYVAARAGDGGLLGTGPYRLAEWKPGRRAVLAAFENYWGGRAFLDAIEIAMGRPLREQLLDLELGKVDLVEISPGEWRRATERASSTWSSAPVELMALAYAPGRAQNDNARLREALAACIDRAAIQSVLLQRQGEISGGLLPQWLSGYAFLFPTAPDPARARRLVAQVQPAARRLSLGYDPADPLARLIADRIALNARDAGITVVPEPRTATSDYRIVMVRIGSLDPAEALARTASALGLAQPARPASPDGLYLAERSLINGYRVIPLFHLPIVLGAGARVRQWVDPAITQLGEWRLENVWISEGKP